MATVSVAGSLDMVGAMGSRVWHRSSSWDRDTAAPTVADVAVVDTAVRSGTLVTSMNTCSRVDKIRGWEGAKVVREVCGDGYH